MILKYLYKTVLVVTLGLLVGAGISYVVDSVNSLNNRLDRVDAGLYVVGDGLCEALDHGEDIISKTTTLHGGMVNLQYTLDTRIKVISARCNELQCANSKLSLNNNHQMEIIESLGRDNNELVWINATLKMKVYNYESQLESLKKKFVKLAKENNELKSQLIPPLPPGGPE